MARRVLSVLGMRKVLVAVSLLLLATTGSAFADRGHRNHRHQTATNARHHRLIVRDHRGVNSRRTVRVEPRRTYNTRYNTRRVVRRPIYSNNGRYRFHDGRTVFVRRPFLNVRYTNYRYRPSLLVENYETVPGYIWVRGNWQWNGYEWQWVSGHYAVDPNYGYNDYGYDGYDGYDDGYDNGYSYAPVSNYGGCD